MKVFFTRSCQHLKTFFPEASIAHVTYFDDREMHLTIDESIQSQETVWLIANITADNQTLFELLMILDFLCKKNAHIQLLLTYTAYMRMDNPQHNETFFGQRILQMLQSFNIEKIWLLHPHKPINQSNIKSILWHEFFVQATQEVDLIVAPDCGAQELAHQISLLTQKKIIALQKCRTDDGITISIPNKLNGERILIVDDIIATGQTIAKAAQVLKSAGASSISAAATHGIFCKNWHELLSDHIDQLYVTDSLLQSKESQTIIPLVPFIKKLINLQ